MKTALVILVALFCFTFAFGLLVQWVVSVLEELSEDISNERNHYPFRRNTELHNKAELWWDRLDLIIDMLVKVVKLSRGLLIIEALAFIITLLSYLHS